MSMWCLTGVEPHLDAPLVPLLSICVFNRCEARHASRDPTEQGDGEGDRRDSTCESEQEQPLRSPRGTCNQSRHAAPIYRHQEASGYSRTFCSDRRKRGVLWKHSVAQTLYTQHTRRRIGGAEVSCVRWWGRGAR